MSLRSLITNRASDNLDELKKNLNPLYYGGYVNRKIIAPLEKFQLKAQKKAKQPVNLTPTQKKALTDVGYVSQKWAEGAAETLPVVGRKFIAPAMSDPNSFFNKELMSGMPLPTQPATKAGQVFGEIANIAPAAIVTGKGLPQKAAFSKGALSKLPVPAQVLLSKGVPTAAVGGTLNKAFGGSLYEGAKAGLKSTPVISAIGQYTNPVIEKVTGGAYRNVTNPLTRQVVSRGTTGLLNVLEGVPMDIGLGQKTTKESMALDFLSGVILSTPANKELKLNLKLALKNMDEVQFNKVIKEAKQQGVVVNENAVKQVRNYIKDTTEQIKASPELGGIRPKEYITKAGKNIPESKQMEVLSRTGRGLGLSMGGTKALKNLDSKSLGDNAGKNEFEDILKAQEMKANKVAPQGLDAPDYRIQHQISSTNSRQASSLSNLDDIVKEAKVKYGYLTKYDLTDLNKLRNMQGNPDMEVKIYRASPVNELNSGDWVTTSKTYATDIKKQNGGKVFEYTVKASDLLYPNNLDELPSLARFSAFKYEPNQSKAGGGVKIQVDPVRNKNLPDTSLGTPSFAKNSTIEYRSKTDQNILQNQPIDSHSSFSSKPIIPQGTEKITSLEDIENIVYGSKTGADITGTKTGNTPLRKIENLASNTISKALTSPNKYVRTMASAMQDLIGGAGKSQAQVRARAQYRGGVDYATKVASDTQNYIYKLLNNDNKSLERVHAVLDPDISKSKVDTNTLTVQEKEAVEVLKKVSDLINDTNYANGFITKSQWLKNRGGKYIARAYEPFDYPPEVADFVRDKSIRFDLNPFKQRGEVTDWKVENSIKDPAYLMSKRLQQTLFNTEIKKYTSWARGVGLISDVQKPGFVQLSDSKAYGDVAGKWIRKDALEDVRGFFFTNDIGQKAYDVLNWYDRNPVRKAQKSLKTVFNPAVRLGNKTGNYVFAWLNGINPVTFSKNKSWAELAIKNNDPLYRYAIKNGIMGTDVTKADIAKISAELKRGVTDKNIIQKIDSVVKESYGRVDDTSKLAALKTWIDRGFSEEEALNRTMRGFQDYNMVGMLYDIGAKIPVLGNPFVRFSSESVRIAKNAVIDHPIRAVSTIAAWKIFTDVMSRISGETDEERTIREKRVGAAHVPFTNISMNVQTPWGEVNASRLIGFSTTFTPEDSSLPDVSKYAPIQNPLDVRSYGSDPLIGPLISIATDKDFRGKSIADPNQNKYQGSLLTDSERNKNRLGYLARSYAPPTITDIYNIGSAFQGQPNVYGQVKTPTQAILRTYPGVKVEQFGSEQVKSYKEREKKYNEYLLKSIDSKIRSIQKDIDSGTLDPIVGRKRIEALQKQKITEVSTSIRRFEESPEAPKTIPEKVKLAAQGIGADPLNTIKAIFTEERMRKISGNALILEREESLNKTPSEDDAVDHIIPLSLGGDNSKSNLRYISKEANREKAKLETKLARQLANKEITKSEARKQIKEWVDTYESGSTYTSADTSTDTEKSSTSESTPTYEGGYIEYTVGESKKKVKKTISMPKLTSNNELNKKIISDYKSDLTDYENYIMYQYERGAITEEKAGLELERVAYIKKALSNATKSGSGKAKKVNLAAISQKILKPVKVEVNTPKLNTFDILSGYSKIKAPTIEAPNLEVGVPKFDLPELTLPNFRKEL